MTIKTNINISHTVLDNCRSIKTRKTDCKGKPINKIEIELEHSTKNVLDDICIAAINLILQKRTDLIAWVVLSNNTWQPKSRIARYNKLWKILKKTHSELFSDIDCEGELELESEHGYKYFIAVRLHSLNKRKVSDVLASGYLFYYILSPSSMNVLDLIKDEWSTEKPYDIKLAKDIVTAGGILIAHIAWFDEKPCVSIFYDSENEHNSVFDNECFWRDIELKI